MLKNFSFRIVIPFFNAERYIGKCIKSIKSQSFKNFTVHLFDDCSTDNSFEVAKSFINNDERFFLNKNKVNQGALQNIIQGLKFDCYDPSKIIDIIIDGDDSLYLNDVLALVEFTYLKTNCLITYGTFLQTGGQGKFGNKYPLRTILTNSYRKYPWLASHLRTFRHDLWLNINNDDLKDNNGNYFDTAWDLAIMFPMLEMADIRQEYISDILYCYNNENPLCDHYIHKESQKLNDELIRNKVPYQKIILP
tara:strand:- start:183 stop:932 length:750 start_codon:yes stop_codon:yes gene_type:complete